MPDTTPHLDDPTTAELMDGVNDARILLGSHEHRQDLAEIAKISNEMIRLDARRTELQASIDKRNKVYLDAEAALHKHLATKHTFVPVGQAASQVTALVAADPEPDLPNWPFTDPDILDGSVMELGDKRYIATSGKWVAE